MYEMKQREVLDTEERRELLKNKDIEGYEVVCAK